MQDYIFLDCLRLEEPTIRPRSPDAMGRRSPLPPRQGRQKRDWVSPVAPPPVSFDSACKTGWTGASAGSSGLCYTGDGEMDVESGPVVEGDMALDPRSWGSVAVAELHGNPPMFPGGTGGRGRGSPGTGFPA